MRWLFSILICVVFAAGTILMFQALKDYETAKAEIVTLQAEQADYEALKGVYDAEEQKVAIVNALWDDLQNVNLKPSDWTMYPLAVSKVLDWKDVEKLLILASNRTSQEPGYYFKPEMIRVSRVVVAQAKDGKEQGGETLVTAEGAAKADALGLPPIQKYDTTLRGAFLIPKSE